MPALGYMGVTQGGLRSRAVLAGTVLLAAFVAVAGTIGTRHLGSHSWGVHFAPAHFADAGDIPTVLAGKRIYLQHCASCHGRALQGQPLWQLRDQDARRRAPALDQTGYTWLRGDAALFAVTKYGHFADDHATTASAMPAYDTVLNDHDILAVVAYIKARLPVGLQVLQASRNPAEAGRPAGADRPDWTFPPDCRPADPSLRARAQLP
jgi:mono/diheme cytochrome c family protein